MLFRSLTRRELTLGSAYNEQSTWVSIPFVATTPTSASGSQSFARTLSQSPSHSQAQSQALLKPSQSRSLLAADSSSSRADSVTQHQQNRAGTASDGNASVSACNAVAGLSSSAPVSVPVTVCVARSNTTGGNNNKTSSNTVFNYNTQSLP